MLGRPGNMCLAAVTKVLPLIGLIFLAVGPVLSAAERLCLEIKPTCRIY